MFESAGMENPKIGTVIVGIITIVITLLTTYLLTRFGRKVLMQVSLGMIFQIFSAKRATSVFCQTYVAWTL